VRGFRLGLYLVDPRLQRIGMRGCCGATAPGDTVIISDDGGFC
jgi:hypothetical protein